MNLSIGLNERNRLLVEMGPPPRSPVFVRSDKICYVNFDYGPHRKTCL